MLLLCNFGIVVAVRRTHCRAGSSADNAYQIKQNKIALGRQSCKQCTKAKQSTQPTISPIDSENGGRGMSAPPKLFIAQCGPDNLC